MQQWTVCRQTDIRSKSSPSGFLKEAIDFFPQDPIALTGCRDETRMIHNGDISESIVNQTCLLKETNDFGEGASIHSKDLRERFMSEM
jgi:hypothetical protein